MDPWDITIAFITIFMSLFGIINPFGNILIFLTLTQNFTPEEKRAVINKTIVVATSVLLLFGLLGNWIFALFGITLASFRIAGGILIFSIGFDMLHAKAPRTKHSEHELQDALEKEALGVTPLGVPLYAGPGAITTVMLFLWNPPSFVGINRDMVFILVFISIFAVMTLSYLTMIYSDRIFRFAGRTGILVLSRIMGLIISAIAIEFILHGIHDVLLEWNIIGG